SAPTRPDKTVVARVYPGRGLTLATTSASGRTRAAAFFPVDVLAATAAPSGYAMPYEARLVLGDDALVLSDLPPQAPLERRAGLSMAVGLG
ncbi:histidine kinase, partial [Pseudomonas sp. MPR-R2A5]